MTFTKWCNSIGIENPRTDANDLVNMSVLKDCWDYQEKQIKLLEEAIIDVSEGCMSSRVLEKMNTSEDGYFMCLAKDTLEKLKELRS